MTEGAGPLGDFYFDGRYINSINKKFGNKKIKTYLLMTFYQFMKWVLVKNKKIRPYGTLIIQRKKLGVF